MKILYMAGSLAFGGLERQFVELIRGVKTHKDIEPIVCYFIETDQGYKSQLFNLDITPNLLERKKKYDLAIFYKIHRFCRKNNIDLIHSFGALAGLVASVYGKFRDIPVIASTVRDAMEYKIPGRFDSIRFQSLLADRFVANSFAGFHKFKRIRHSFRVVYNGIDSERFRINHDKIGKIRIIYNLDSFEYIVSMVASFSNKKDFDTLVEAIPMVLQSQPSTCFVLVGDGSERPRIEEKVRKLLAEDNVIFTGYTEEVIGILANTHVSVLMTNSLNHVEGTSNSLLESLAMGVPVIASRGGGTDEVVEDGINGMLVNPFDADGLANRIIEILNDGNLRKRLGEEGKMTVSSKFGFDRYIREYIGMYNEIIKGY